MNAERWKRIDELFDAVLEIPEARREDFLSSKCDGDDDLKKEVLSLVEAQEKTIKFMEISAMNLMGKELAAEKTDFADNSLYNKTLGNYKIEKPLGAGGMGEVYLAHDIKLDRKVALKILPKEFVSSEERVRRFEIEARAVSALNHPYIVTVYDVGKIEDINYIATEYVEGKTVRELIGNNPSIKETLSIILQTAEALAEAHKAGIIHRDIKPENIMVRPDGYVKVLDFGLAKLIEPDLNNPAITAQTMKGAIIGTLAYMSPEQISGDKIDQRTDLWSLSVVLYEMLSGKNPFKGENRQLTYQNILSEESAPLSESNAQIPAELNHILIKALEKESDLRYQTASDLRADLKRARRELDSSPSWNSNSRQSAVKSKIKAKRQHLKIYAALLILLLIGGAGAFVYVRYFYNNKPDEWKNAKNVPLTDQAGTEYYPSLAPDGNSFVFAGKSDNGSYDILEQRVGGRNVRNLTPGSPAEDTQPSFSPDGKYIVFRSERKPEGIYIMESTGENLRRVCDFGYNPAWSPDGKEIVVSIDNFDFPLTRNTNSLFIVNVANGEKRLLITGYATQPNWSPNGKRIAFWMPQRGGRLDVATVSVSGGEPVLITSFSNTNWNPVWSPDGRYLYFSSDRGGNMAFWRVAINQDTGETLDEPELVATPAKFNQHLSFSRDGKRMIYVQTDNQSNIKAVGFDEKTGRITGEPYWITRRDQGIVRPELSPDGENYVMRLSRLTQEDIVLVSRDGTKWRDLTNDEYFDRYPRWSPDGKQIAFSSDRSGKYEIWMIDADGGNLHQVTFNTPSTASLPVWSPDGKKLLYDINHKTQILDLTKSWSEQTSQQIPNSEIYKYCMIWDWSPDGEKLFGLFSPKQDKSYRGVYYLKTGTSEAMIDAAAAAVPTWLADNKRVIYAQDNKIIVSDTISGEERELFALPQDKIASVGINRENNLIYFTVSTSESDIWMLDASQN